MAQRIDLTGKKIGRLRVLGRAKDRIRTNGQVRHQYLVVCTCGTRKTVLASNLASGDVRSCGCLRTEVATKHGQSAKPSKAYRCWVSMIHRCENKGCRAYKNYGGRGITVCARWRDSFEAFFADMGPGEPGTWLERIDNSKGYSPDNCCWATTAQQARNRRSNARFTHGNRTMVLSDWAKSANMNVATLASRLRRGIPFEKAISTAVLKRRKQSW